MTPDHTLRRMLTEWCWLARSDRAARIDAPMTHLSFHALRRLYANAGWVRVDGERLDLATAWLQHPQRITVARLLFDPGVPRGIHSCADGTLALSTQGRHW